jgi:hypothetical protein
VSFRQNFLLLQKRSFCPQCAEYVKQNAGVSEVTFFVMRSRVSTRALAIGLHLATINHAIFRIHHGVLLARCPRDSPSFIFFSFYSANKSSSAQPYVPNAIGRLAACTLGYAKIFSNIRTARAEINMIACGCHVTSDESKRLQHSSASVGLYVCCSLQKEE